MQLYEFESKELFAEAGIPIPDGYLCYDFQSLQLALSERPGQRWVAKCQIRAGGRQRAGGVKVNLAADAVLEFGQHWFGQRLVTLQTQALGEPVAAILLEPMIEVVQQVYCAWFLHRQLGVVRVLVSVVAGQEIEQALRSGEERCVHIDLPASGKMLPHQAVQLGESLNFSDITLKAWTELALRLNEFYFEHDLIFLEINPVGITNNLKMPCCVLDAKLTVDDHALFRQPRLKAMIAKRITLEQAGSLNYIPLDGNIACLANGAGLAMATMDALLEVGGKPANFLDIGGRLNWEAHYKNLCALLLQKQVSVLLLNLFGGIVNCEKIVRSIIVLLRFSGIKIPIVARLAGYGARSAIRYLQKQQDYEVVFGQTQQEGVELAVKLAKEK